MTCPTIQEQLARLDNSVDRVWWFAQLERGIEVADIDREPRYGSDEALRVLAEVRESDDDRNPLTGGSKYIGIFFHG